LKLQEAHDASGAEVIYQAHSGAPAERGVIIGVNGLLHAMVRYGTREQGAVKATPLNRLAFAHHLSKVIKLHRATPADPHPTICADATCNRRHDWKRRCSCGEVFHTGRLKYTNDRAKAHQYGREYKP
jgi:hypothetical protein